MNYNENSVFCYLKRGLMAQDLCLEGLVLAQQQVDGGQVVTDISLQQG